MFLGVEHGGFIFSSYLFTAIAFVVLIIVVWSNLRRQRQRLTKLEASGATRRRKRSKTKKT